MKAILLSIWINFIKPQLVSMGILKPSTEPAKAPTGEKEER